MTCGVNSAGHTFVICLFNEFVIGKEQDYSTGCCGKNRGDIESADRAQANE